MTPKSPRWVWKCPFGRIFKISPFGGIPRHRKSRIFVPVIGSDYCPKRKTVIFTSLILKKMSKARKSNNALKPKLVSFFDIQSTSHVYTLGNLMLVADNIDGSDDKESYFKVNPLENTVTLPSYMSILCKQGNMHIRLNGRDYDFHPNDFMVIMPGSTGLCLEMSPDFKLAVVMFSSEFHFEKFYANYSYESIQMWKYLSMEEKLTLKPEQMDECLSVYRMMKRKLMEQDFKLKNDVVLSYLNILFCNFYQYFSLAGLSEIIQSGNKKDVYNYFFRFMTLVRENCRKERGITFYADMLCLTPKYLSQVIYKCSGSFASEWIRKMVILEAKSLLDNKNFSVQQISDMMNFPNPSFFGKYFKAATGLTPRKYRMQ